MARSIYQHVELSKFVYRSVNREPAVTLIRQVSRQRQAFPSGALDLTRHVFERGSIAPNRHNAGQSLSKSQSYRTTDS